MELPVKYDSLTPQQRRLTREAYILIQNGLCKHCGEPLTGQASKEVMDKKINTRLFPKNFFDHPVHLHHSHDTGLTIGAIHCHCNAVLWQYYGE